MNEEKLMSQLDSVESKLNDYVKSGAAAHKAAAEGVEKLQSEILEMRKQNQEIAQMASKISASSKGEREVFSTFGKGIVDGFRNKAASTTTTAGGYLVDDESDHTIRSVQNTYGLVRRIWGDQIIPMVTDTLTVPTDTFEVSGVSGTGNVPTPASTSENSAITESADAVLGQITLTCTKYATLNYISNELLQDSFVSFIGAYLIPKIARQMSKIEDTVVFTTATTGLFNSSNMQRLVMDGGNTAFVDMTVDDLINMEDEVASDALMDAMYLGHRSVINIVKKLKGTDGQYIWNPAAGPEPATINGYSVMKGDILPARSATAISTGFIAFGDPAKAAVVGERMGRSIKVSEEYRFNYDQAAIRMTERFAYNSDANIGNALCVLVTAAS